MAVKNYYELLDLAPTATSDEIKRAFRLQIARYHPDKVQHLGKEFQDMAADQMHRVVVVDRRAVVDAGAPLDPVHEEELQVVGRLHLVAGARGHLARTAEARTAFGASGNPLDRRRSLAPRIITVFRTDADPRTVDLSLDPSERPYGSLFGKRPDLINYGLTGFGRLTTPEAWLSTWSGLSSNAFFHASTAAS